ncbi:hypothetical protein AM1BK_38150 [Neobacillus kokaensis]|uniref:Uncharacterized protein n=1 Tax=Neobacillus kokaensis TaxID=2759023 RepID=A0ABQ3N9B0_9BACI|nr:hypothetical protein AM1BK_38150 [Neobacillus kokaensis]
MTVVHVLNFSIPIAFIVFAGFMLDKMCKPSNHEEKAGEE